MEKLYTTQQVAEILGCNPQNVRYLIRTGLLQATNIARNTSTEHSNGNRYRVPESALTDFACGGTDATVPPQR